MGKNMTRIATPADAPVEGRRERKRRETRERIIDVAMAMFCERGFDAVTVNEIAEAADVSKRSLFDYFPSKEELVNAWQDEFAVVLAEAVTARPASETFTQVVERAMIEALVSTTTVESLAIGTLIRNTPALHARNQLKFHELEAKLVEALQSRKGAKLLRSRLLAMMVIGALRIGTDEWQTKGTLTDKDMGRFSKKVFAALWKEVGAIA